MKTPWRFLGFVFGFLFMMLVGGHFFPKETQAVAMTGLMIWMPIAVVTMIWWVVWNIRNPPPPREECSTCHQLMPEKDDE